MASPAMIGIEKAGKAERRREREVVIDVRLSSHLGFPPGTTRFVVSLMLSPFSLKWGRVAESIPVTVRMFGDAPYSILAWRSVSL